MKDPAVNKPTIQKSNVNLKTKNIRKKGAKSIATVAAAAVKVERKEKLNRVEPYTETISSNRVKTNDKIYSPAGAPINKR